MAGWYSNWEPENRQAGEQQEETVSIGESNEDSMKEIVC